MGYFPAFKKDFSFVNENIRHLTWQERPYLNARFSNGATLMVKQTMFFMTVHLLRPGYPITAIWWRPPSKILYPLLGDAR